MRVARLLAISLVAMLVLALAAAPVQAATPAIYAAVGDSYSSGLGASSSYTDGSCDQSSKSFSALWSAAHPDVRYVQLACAGAKTTDVTDKQIPNVPSDATLVSITVGGNDVGFSSIMTTCALHGTSACVSAVNAAEAYVNTTLPAQLDVTFAAVRARAQGARVVVLSYPVFYQLNVFFCIGLSSTSRAKIDEGINLVDGAIATAAARRNFVFADVRSAFVGHQLCSGSKWLHAVDLADIQESYHPTAAGQSQGYLPTFTAAAAAPPTA